MFTLPILPDEIRIPLDRYEVEGADGSKHVICEYPGVVAFARPFGLEEASRLNDALAADPNSRSLNATAIVHRHVTRIDGLNMQDPTGAAVAFDVNNVAHKRSIPMPMRDAIYLALRDRASLSTVTEKNSDLPSGSGGKTSTETSPAGSAVSASATP